MKILPCTIVKKMHRCPHCGEEVITTSRIPDASDRDINDRLRALAAGLDEYTQPITARETIDEAVGAIDAQSNRIEKLESALRVLHTWAMSDALAGDTLSLDPMNVADLCRRTLDP